MISRASSFFWRQIVRQRIPLSTWGFVSLILKLGGFAFAAESSNPLELLETHCVGCHGGAGIKGGLDLTTREGLLRGGESGATVIPGDPESSLLLQTIRHEHEPFMPYKENKLSAPAIDQLAAWIKSGASYLRPLDKSSGKRKTDAGFVLTDADRAHWAFQPITRVKPPVIPQPASVGQNPIDQFILDKLTSIGLSLAPTVNRTMFIRRVTLDLIGLPPTPAEIDDFVHNPSPSADEELIDRLLASPHYGERWGRHWLDLARYAESDGFEHDAVRPHAWRYRDYVIKTLNDDKPYDRFIREQIAGDELWPEDAEAITATGFHLLGPDMVDSSDQIQRRHNTLNDMTDTTALVFLGLTFGCARCHDHKFEPLSQRDYYGFQAFFTPAKFNREKSIATPSHREAYAVAMREYDSHPKLQELIAFEATIRKKLFEQKVARLPAEAQVAHLTPPEQRTAEQSNLVLETEAKVKVSDKELTAVLTADEKQRQAEIRKEIEKLPKPPALPVTMAIESAKDSKAKTFLLTRGDYNQPGDEITPGIPLVLSPQPGSGRLKTSVAPASVNARERADGSLPSMSRVNLANWVASPENPLTARVMVNRIWQHHFGQALVSTPSDFGTHGQSASHPSLLDWLASDFIKRGWSIKQMHRLMLTSATYRQVSTLKRNSYAHDATAADLSSTLSNDTAAWAKGIQLDPDNRLYWRMNRIRLEGEVIRDGLLAISGQLNSSMNGPGVSPPIPKELFAGAHGWTVSELKSQHHRRSIYIFARRNLRFPFLEVFDAPDNNLSCSVRERSTTAPQSLTLLNSTEVTAAAKVTAVRLNYESASTQYQIESAYLLTLGRKPTASEQVMVQKFLINSPWDEFCRALFNLNEFVYVE
jgi:Protein of unknown function (DUF1553)/Protein of unknown function (DUF1549)/Planctomycete cytochrome C